MLYKTSTYQSPYKIGLLVWFVVLSAAPHNDEGWKSGRFQLLWESQGGCWSLRNTTRAGCYVEIAPIWNVIKLVWLLASEKIHSSFSHLKWKCIECFAEKYLEGTVGCWIFVIQLALCSWNEFWDELSIVVSPLTFQRYAAFEPWIYCNLFFFYYWCVVEL